MAEIAKPIRLSSHVRAQFSYRGTNEREITEAIQKSPWEAAELGRLQCRMDFEYHQEWNGKRYRTKQVRPIFAEEKDAIVVVTVYVYYF